METSFDFIADQEAKRKASLAEMKRKREEKNKPVVAVGGGQTTVEGKSLGRVTAGYEEQHGEAFVGKNPETVVIGKRVDWKNGQ